MELLVLVLPDTPRHNIRFTGLSRGFVVMASGTFLLDQETTTSFLVQLCPDGRQTGNYPETLVLYRTRPARLPKSTCHLIWGASDTAV